jgi:hypothetical protein
MTGQTSTERLTTTIVNPEGIITLGQTERKCLMPQKCNGCDRPAEYMFRHIKLCPEHAATIAVMKKGVPIAAAVKQ